MAGRRSAGLLATAAALTLPLWLASCASGVDPSPHTRLPAQATGVDRIQPETPLAPVPQPQAPPPAGKSPVDGTAPALTPPDMPSTAGLGEPGQPPAPGSDGPQPGGTDTGPGEKSAKPPADRIDPPLSPNVPSSTAAAAPPVEPLPAAPLPAEGRAIHTVAVYYVLLDDGGASGVRFGCNDSLAEVPRPATPSAEPLGAAMRALLDGSAQPVPGAYNALSESTLVFLSGTFDGTTVTAYLSGTIRPSGACDIPRIEAQLTQTAVTSVGAIRAEIYVNGVGLTEALSLK